ncbi:MAG TPA: formate--tetrahydrofolate ligase [Thermoanaerobaculia bacterium]|nr:formate--tetrahydrofolate ligase [Thermoanaerobaculia bacterium]
MNQTPAPRPIAEVARDLRINPKNVILYGDDKAKVRLAGLEDARDRPRGRLVLVSAITPTAAGEGKTTTSIGLAQGLARIGERACLALREPSLGPIFGMKGGATGGGRAVLVPGEDINLHFTGDFHAITAAHNLLASLLDNHLHYGNGLRIESRRVWWRRVLDINDRALRDIVIGLGGPFESVPRETGFDITAASEVMAVLCLAEDAEDLRARLARLVVGLSLDGTAVTAEHLEAVGAMMVLLKDTLMPNLVQTAEGVPAFVHGGPFGNIAHGCNSVIATKMALSHADWVVTEAGFAFDLGAEKFFDIKCRSAGLEPAAVVLVATVRALKLHGGIAKDRLAEPDPAAVERGLDNLRKHVESAQTFGYTPIVTLNRFATDSEEEIDVVRRDCAGLGVPFAVADHFARGGEGAVELARAVMEQVSGQASGQARGPRPFTPLYDWSEPVKDKMEKIARAMYGARGVVWEPHAERDLKLIQKLGHEGLPLCVAKTQASLSDNPALAGRPRDFEVTVRRLILAAGAGYVVPLLGDIIRMPGLPKSPQAHRMDLVDGRVVGLMGG